MIAAAASANRTPRCLRQSYERYFRNKNSSDNFVRWSMIMAVAGALECRVWTQTEQGPIYPNFFVMLLGSPASGKTAVLKPLKTFLHSTGVARVAPDTMTAASLIDVMAENLQARSVEGHPITHCSLTIASAEFGSLMPSYDQAMLTRMSELYDCNTEYESRTRGGGLIKIEQPCLNLIFGVQPKFLISLMPDTAWQQGFMARTIIVYSSAVHYPTYEQLFGFEDTSPEHETAALEIKGWLKKLTNWYGPMSWSREAGLKLVNWIQGSQEPKPKHPKLEHYCTRRWFQLIKLCMVFAAIDGQRRVEEAHVTEAMEVLFEAEATMSEGFLDMAQSPDHEVIKQSFAWLITNQAIGPVTEVSFRNYLASMIPIERIEVLLTHMKAVGIVDTAFSTQGPLVKAGKLGVLT